MEKVTQEFTMQHLMCFMEKNENIVSLDLTNTGLNIASIK